MFDKSKIVNLLFWNISHRVEDYTMKNSREARNEIRDGFSQGWFHLGKQFHYYELKSTNRGQIYYRALDTHSHLQFIGRLETNTQYLGPLRLRRRCQRMAQSLASVQSFFVHLHYQSWQLGQRRGRVGFGFIGREPPTRAVAFRTVDLSRWGDGADRTITDLYY